MLEAVAWSDRNEATSDERTAARTKGRGTIRNASTQRHGLLSNARTVTKSPELPTLSARRRPAERPTGTAGEIDVPERKAALIRLTTSADVPATSS